MNNLNFFILFSTLIYFKLEENKSGNLKIAVGLIALYALYNLLKGGVEGWNPYTYQRDKWFQDLDGKECETGKGTFFRGASPPEFPYDHCGTSDGKICGSWDELEIMNLIGSPPPGQASPSFQYTDSNVDRQCKTVTCRTDSHCISNNKHKYCSENGTCVICDNNEHCGDENLECIKGDDDTNICVDKRNPEIDIDLNTYKKEMCKRNNFLVKYSSPPSSPSNNECLSVPAADEKPGVLGLVDGWFYTCCETSKGIVFAQVIGPILFAVGLCLIKYNWNREKPVGPGPGTSIVMVIVGFILFCIAFVSKFWVDWVSNL
jgi:hypothetical protein